LFRQSLKLTQRIGFGGEDGYRGANQIQTFRRTKLSDLLPKPFQNAGGVSHGGVLENHTNRVVVQKPYIVGSPDALRDGLDHAVG